MKIFDAAHIQHVELSNSLRFQDQETGSIKNHDINHVFLTPTFDINNTDSYTGINANEAIKRFTDNLSKRYGATSYLWVKEFTEKLTPHFHMMVTLPKVPISDLNRAWSHARGDIQTVKNALRTGYDPKTKKSVMRVSSYRAAVGYAAKYITKADYGDISVFKTSCRIQDRQTWEYRTGHSSKCYGVSQNLHRPPRNLDYFMQVNLHPWLSREQKEVKTDFADLFFFDNLHTKQLLYNSGTEIRKKQSEKIKNFIPKKVNYSRFDQIYMNFSQSDLK